MDWTLVALLQMFIITVAVSTAFGLRIRSVNKQNDELREHAEVASEALEAQKAAQNPKPEEWLKEKIEALPEDDEYTPLQTLVLQHAIKKNKKLSEQLAELVNVGGSDSAPAEGDAEQSDELKGLLQQFTRDSREMMACIQTLEKENAQLLAELGRSPETPAADSVTEPAETEIVTEDSSPEKDATTTQPQEQSENRNTDPEPAPETNTDTTSEEVPPEESEDSDATEAPDDTQLAAESEDSVEPSEETTDDGTDAEEQAEKQSEASQNEAETLDAAAIDELLETEPETEAKKSEENAA